MLEKVIQSQIIQYLAILQNKKLLAYYRLPSGPRINNIGKKTIFLKSQCSGISDLVILPNKLPTIWAEIKQLKGRLSADQKAFQETCNRLGHSYVVWRSLDDCITHLENLGIKL